VLLLLRRMGHNSLHSCFENAHGAQCATCLKEVYYSYTEHEKHKTAAQIRRGIIKAMEAGKLADRGFDQLGLIL